MVHHIVLSLAAVLTLAASPEARPEKVALRAANGRFLGVANDGTLRAEAFYPADKETFQLLTRGEHEISLRADDGQVLVPDPRDGHRPLLAVGTFPAGQDAFQLLPAAGHRFALRGHSSGARLVFGPAVKDAAPAAPGQPSPRETVEIYRVHELPAVLQTALPAVIRSLAKEELAGKKYDKTQQHETKKYIDLPAPTLSDPKRTKRRQILGITEEYRVQAELDGEVEIRIPNMSLLTSYAEGGPGLILLAVEASLPARGRVEGKVEKLASGSTGYRLAVQLAAVGEIVIRHADNDVAFDPPVVSDLRLAVSRMEFSNDVLEVLRRQIRQVVNRELAHNEQRIRQSATGALQKAVASHEVKIPLMGWLLH